MILDDIDIAEKALFSFTCKTIPRSKEEGSNLSVLRNHPFFRISGKKDLDEKSGEYYYGAFHSALGEYFSPAVFKRLQSAFEVSLSNLKNRDIEFISGKLVSLARVKEISNLRLETISEIMGVQWMEHFLSERSKFMGKSYPRQLTVIMTYECNLNCSFCYSMQQAAQEPGYLDNKIERLEEISTSVDFGIASITGIESNLEKALTMNKAADTVKQIIEETTVFLQAQANVMPEAALQLLTD